MSDGDVSLLASMGNAWHRNLGSDLPLHKLSLKEVASVLRSNATLLHKTPVGHWAGLTFSFDNVRFEDGPKSSKQAQYLKAIAVEKRNSLAYSGLGGVLSFNETVTLSNGRIITQRECFIEAIARDNRNALAYVGIGATLADGESVRLSDGRTLNKRQCFLEAIMCDDHNSRAYVGLNATLADGDSVTLLDGRTLNRRQCLIEAIKCDRDNGYAYNFLGAILEADEFVTLTGGRRFTKQQCFLEAIACDNTNPHPYYNLGLTLGNEPVTLKDKRCFSKSQCFIEALARDKSNSYAFVMLGELIQPFRSVNIPRGPSLNNRECFVEAIACDPRNSFAYSGLGVNIPVGESVTLKDGRTVTGKQCLLEAITCDNSNSCAYSGLGATLPDGEVATLNDGRRITKQQCFIEAIARDSRNSYAFVGLATTLADRNVVRLLSGRVMTSNDCILEALAIDNRNSIAYIALGVTLQVGESTTLTDGRQINKQQCFLEAIGPYFSSDVSYIGLSETLGVGESVTLKDGRTLPWRHCLAQAINQDQGRNPIPFYNFGVTLGAFDTITVDQRTTLNRQQCFLYAISRHTHNADAYVSLGPSLSFAYIGLGATLRNNESVRPMPTYGRPQRTLSKQDCFLKAIDCDSRNGCAYSSLGEILGPGECASLSDGRTLTKQQCFLEAIACDSRKADPYAALGETLGTGASVTLIDGRTFSKQQCFLEAIACNVSKANSYMALGEALGTDESVAMVDGSVFNKRQCFAKAIACGDCGASPYIALGATLGVGESVNIGERSMTKQQCFLEAIELNDNIPHPYIGLSEILTAGESVTLQDGRVLNKQLCFVNAIARDDKNSSLYIALGKHLNIGETVALMNGTTLNKLTCFVEAIACDSGDSTAFVHLGKGLAPLETITLKDGRILTKQQCFVEAITCNPGNSVAYQQLGETLKPGEIIRLKDGRKVSMEECVLASDTNFNHSKRTSLLIKSAEESNATAVEVDASQVSASQANTSASVDDLRSLHYGALQMLCKQAGEVAGLSFADSAKLTPEQWMKCHCVGFDCREQMLVRIRKAMTQSANQQPSSPYIQRIEPGTGDGCNRFLFLGDEDVNKSRCVRSLVSQITGRTLPPATETSQSRGFLNGMHVVACNMDGSGSELVDATDTTKPGDNTMQLEFWDIAAGDMSFPFAEQAASSVGPCSGATFVLVLDGSHSNWLERLVWWCRSLGLDKSRNHQSIYEVVPDVIILLTNARAIDVRSILRDIVKKLSGNSLLQERLLYFWTVWFQAEGDVLRFSATGGIEAVTSWGVNRVNCSDLSVRFIEKPTLCDVTRTRAAEVDTLLRSYRQTTDATNGMVSLDGGLFKNPADELWSRRKEEIMRSLDVFCLMNYIFTDKPKDHLLVSSLFDVSRDALSRQLLHFVVPLTVARLPPISKANDAVYSDPFALLRGLDRHVLSLSKAKGKTMYLVDYWRHGRMIRTLCSIGNECEVTSVAAIWWTAKETRLFDTLIDVTFHLRTHGKEAGEIVTKYIAECGGGAVLSDNEEVPYNSLSLCTTDSKDTPYPMTDLHTHLTGNGSSAFWVDVVMFLYLNERYEKDEERMKELRQTAKLSNDPTFWWNGVEIKTNSNFTTDVVYEKDALEKAFLGFHPDGPALSSTENVDCLWQLESMVTNSKSLLFRDWFKEYSVIRSGKIEVVTGLPNKYFIEVTQGRNTSKDRNSYVEKNEADAIYSRLCNCFTMLSKDGANPGLEDLADYRGRFTPQFDPMRYAMKDPILKQRPEVYSLLLNHACSRYAQNHVRYVEFSVSSKQILNYWVYLSEDNVWPRSGLLADFLNSKRSVIEECGVEICGAKPPNLISYRFLVAFARSGAQYDNLLTRFDDVVQRGAIAVLDRFKKALDAIRNFDPESDEISSASRHTSAGLKALDELKDAALKIAHLCCSFRRSLEMNGHSSIASILSSPLTTAQRIGTADVPAWSDIRLVMHEVVNIDRQFRSLSLSPDLFQDLTAEVESIRTAANAARECIDVCNSAAYFLSSKHSHVVGILDRPDCAKALIDAKDIRRVTEEALLEITKFDNLWVHALELSKVGKPFRDRCSSLLPSERRLIVAKIWPLYVHHSSDIAELLHKDLISKIKDVYEAYCCSSTGAMATRTSFLREFVVGFDFVGDEDGFPVSPFVSKAVIKMIDHIRKVREADHSRRASDIWSGFGIRLHGGENVKSGSNVASDKPLFKEQFNAHMQIIHHEVVKLREAGIPARIGHGIAFLYSEKPSLAPSLFASMRADLKRYSVPCELNMTSNHYLVSRKFCDPPISGPDSPASLKEMLLQKLDVCLSTDNDGIWVCGPCKCECKCPEKPCKKFRPHMSVHHEFCVAIRSNCFRDSEEEIKVLQIGWNTRFGFDTLPTKQDDESKFIS